MRWPVMTLERVVDDLQPGFASRPVPNGSGIPQLRTNNVSSDGRIDLSEVKSVPASDLQLVRYTLRPGDVLFNNTNSPVLVGKTAYFSESGTYLFSNHMTRIRVRSALVEPRYLARFLHWTWSTGGFRKLVTQWVNQAAINRSQLASVAVPLPPLSEQRRIVEILDQADALRRLRAEADTKAERILPALFINMFGDPATNPMRWPTTRLGDVVIDTQYGTSQRANPLRAGVAVIRMNNITISGELDLSDLKYVQLSDREVERYLLRQDDILFNRTNSAELVGKTGIWRNYGFDAVPASYLIRVRIAENKAIPRFVWAFMNSAFIKQTLLGKARRAIGMSNINAKELMDLPLVLPDLRIQSTFVKRLDAFDLATANRRKAERKIEQLFGSLVHSAFSGDLTASWREAHMKELLQEMDHQARLLGRGE